MTMERPCEESLRDDKDRNVPQATQNYSGVSLALARPLVLVVGIFAACAIFTMRKGSMGAFNSLDMQEASENDDSVIYYLSRDPHEVSLLGYPGVFLASWNNSYRSKYMKSSVSVSQIIFEEANTTIPSSNEAYLKFSEDSYLLAENGTFRLSHPGEADYECVTTEETGGCMVFVSSGTLLRMHAHARASRMVVLSSGSLSLTETTNTSQLEHQYFKTNIECGPLYNQSGSCSGTVVSSTTTNCAGGLFDNFDGDISPPFPKHYHPRGAFYYVVSGRMSFGDSGKFRDYKATKHDMRFVEPHVYYGPESSSDASTVFLSVHEPDPAVYGDYVRALHSESGGRLLDSNLSTCAFACEAKSGKDPITCTFVD